LISVVYSFFYKTAFKLFQIDVLLFDTSEPDFISEMVDVQ